MGHSLDTVRNIAIVAQGGAGKAEFIESILFRCKAIKKKGSFEKGDLMMFTEPEEVERKMAIVPHVGHFKHEDIRVNFIDCPGYFHFLESTRAVLPGVDGTIIVFSGVDGAKPEADRLLELLKEQSVPTIAFMNQMAKEQADFEKRMESIKTEVSIPILPVTIPVGNAEAFEGFIDLIFQKAKVYKGGKLTEIEIPAEYNDRVEYWRTQLVEKLAEADDVLIEKYLEGEELTNEELFGALKQAIIKGDFIPLYCGDTSKDIGVNRILNAITRIMPCPVEREEARPAVGTSGPGKEDEVKRSCQGDSPFSAVTLRTTVDPFSGKLSVVRVLSGKVSDGETIYNTTKDKKQKVGHLYLLQGKEIEQVSSLEAGQIGAIAKLDDTNTCDTLCAEKEQVCYPSIEFMSPQLSYAVEADKKAEEKVSSGLMRLAEEDPTIKVHREKQTGELILEGMGQSHLEVVLTKLERKFGGKATLKPMQVPYRETVRSKVEKEGKLKKQSGGHGQFAKCILQVEPLPRDGGFEFADMITGGVIPKQFIPSVEKGVHDAMKKGVLGEYPVIDVKVSLVDGQFHAVDSSDHAFQVAGSVGFKAAMGDAKPVLLEPIMTMEISLPEDNTGDVMKDLSGRRGKVLGMDPKGKRQLIRAEAPLSEILEYGNILGAITSGRGLFSMKLSGYAEVPDLQSAKVIEERKKILEAD